MPWTTNKRIPNQQSSRSPALAEFRGELHMVHPGRSSNDIWHSVYDGTDWSIDDVRIPDQRSKASSALASFQNRLHIAHLGSSSNRIWHSSFDGNRWTTNSEILEELSQASPAMAVFNDRLHLLHIGNASHRIYHLEFDGSEWTKRPENEGLENQRSKGAVALAVFNGELHMVHQGDTSNRLWHTRFNGTRWSENEVIEGQLSKSPPALATLNGLLHLLHLGDSSNRIWHSTFDGAWADNIPIPYQLSKAAPGFTSFGNRIHMAHLGDSSNDIWHSSSDGVLVRRPERRVIVLDVDGVRWDSFYRHLKRVRDAGASTDVTYSFSLPPGASDDTVLDDGELQLRSALAELCFAEDNGMVDVRLALAPYPSFTFPSHGTMYTGDSPGVHGITGHTFVVRDAAPEWDRHAWNALPRALALQGYCTDAESDAGALADYIWGGFDTVGENSCRNRNRGIVSDVRVKNMFEFAHESGLRTCAIHSFYHGAETPWTNEGRDQWWRYSPPELSSVKDICSDDDIDELEFVDHGALVKAELLLTSMPSKVRVTSPNSNVLPSIPASANKLSGETHVGWSVRGEPHPDGIPDLIAIYLASVDHSSHLNGIRDQETYLAWFDHRLARFVRALRRVDPTTFENTVFAFITDHGHTPVSLPPESDGVPSSNNLAAREELVRILMGNEEGNDFLKLAKTISQQQYAPSYDWLVAEAIEDDFLAYAEAMNLYVYVRNSDKFSTIEVARRLLENPMRTEAYGALVLVQGRYQFMARGERSAMELTDPKFSEVVLPHLDMPPTNMVEIDSTSLSPQDADAEMVLRTRLRTSEGLSLLQVVERIVGFQPVSINQSPDIVLLAPARQSFTSGHSTHGSFAYHNSRIPMVFCGPGMPSGRSTIETARLIDFAPTVLSLLGVTQTEMEGQALLDRSGVRRAARRESRADGAASTRLRPRRASTASILRRFPRVTALLRPAVLRAVTKMESAERSELPVLVAVSLHSSRTRREVIIGDSYYLEVQSAMAFVTGNDDAWIDVAGKRHSIKTGSQIPFAQCKTIRIQSKQSYGSIEIQRAYMVISVSIALPRMPAWLIQAVEEGARASRILIDEPKISSGSITVSAGEFENRVKLLEAQFAAADVVSEGTSAIDPRLTGIEPICSESARVERAVGVLRSLLEKQSIAKMTTPGHFCSG